MKKTCVLAYSGGLDTSAIIPWLIENYQVEVLAYCCNVGNLPPDKELRDKAIKLGAKDFIYEDAQDEFVRDYVYPMLRGGATYFDDYLLGTAIARPLIAEKVAKFAKKVNADIIAHGATGKGNDHIRFERTWSFLCPEIEVLAPWKIWNYRSREELIAFLRERGTVWGETKKTYSVDLNTFHRSCEGGDLEDIEKPYERENVQDWLRVAPETKPTALKLGIRKGDIVSINGKDMPPRLALETLNEMGSRYGIGICDIVEERYNGIKSRGVYETPGGTLAHTAIKAMKQICWSRELYSLGQHMGRQLGQLIYDGLWFSDTCLAANKFFEAASEKLTGEIAVELNPGFVRILHRISPNTLYKPEVVSFESDSMDIHKAALGYTKILTISSMIQGQRERGLRH